jgi:hypothetical protein
MYTMFSSLFRQPTPAPTSSNAAVLEYNRQCMATYTQIIAMNTQIITMNARIVDDMRQTTSMLMNTLPRSRPIRTCPNNHGLVAYSAVGGNCDVCNGVASSGDLVMYCRECDWYMCAACARTNGVAMPRQETLVFDGQLNSQGFLDFITQLTQRMQEDVDVVPTEAQINKACVVMPANQANISEQYACPIDLTPIEAHENIMKIKQCVHVFRESNLRELFTRDVKCPMCRFDIRDHVEVTAGNETTF